MPTGTRAHHGVSAANCREPRAAASRVSRRAASATQQATEWLSLHNHSEDLFEAGEAEAALAEAVGAEADHALHQRDLLDVFGGAALDDQALDFLREDHHLMNPKAAAIAGTA